MSESLWNRESTWNIELRREKLRFYVKRNTSIPDYNATKALDHSKENVNTEITNSLREARHVLEAAYPRFNEQFELHSSSKLDLLPWAKVVEERDFRYPKNSANSAKIVMDGERKLYPISWVARRPLDPSGKFLAPILIPLDYGFEEFVSQGVIDFQTSNSETPPKAFVHNCTRVLEEIERKGSHVVGYFVISLKEPLRSEESAEGNKAPALGMNPEAAVFSPK